MANLFFFTQHFPFKEGSETFIENEIPIASECFDQIYVLPLQFDKYVRELPANFTLIEPPFKSRSEIIKKGLNGLSFRVICDLFKEFFHGKFWKSWSVTRSFIIQSLIFAALLNSPQLKKVCQLIRPDDVLYSYWGMGWGMAIPFCLKLKNKFYARFHRGDLYAERGGALLFREPLLQRLDRAIFISKQGEKYQHNRFPDIDFSSEVSYLGTNDFGTAQRSSDGKLRIVSCSHIKPVKRVDLIFKALVEMGCSNIEWTHIGGSGEDLDNFRKVIDATPHKFKITLTGTMSNNKVMKWFAENPADVFINVSSSEGLPVSIMEAISFNIPVIATNVGGTSEIVTDEAGILISENPTTVEISDAIRKVCQMELSPRKVWLEKFRAQTNYKKFFMSL